MSVMDIVIIVAVVVALIWGYYKGVIAQLGAVAGVLLGIVSCRFWGDDFAQVLNKYLTDSTSTTSTSVYLNDVIANVLLFLLVYVGTRLLSKMLRSVTHTLCLGVVDRIGGAVFSVVQVLVVISLLMNLWLAMFPESPIIVTATGFANERLLNLAPDLFGSEKASEFWNTVK